MLYLHSDMLCYFGELLCFSIIFSKVLSVVWFKFSTYEKHRQLSKMAPVKVRKQRLAAEDT